MEENHGGGWCPGDHGISGTGQWLDGQKELGCVPVGGSLGLCRIVSGERVVSGQREERIKGRYPIPPETIAEKEAVANSIPQVHAQICSAVQCSC